MEKLKVWDFYSDSGGTVQLGGSEGEDMPCEGRLILSRTREGARAGRRAGGGRADDRRQKTGSVVHPVFAFPSFTVENTSAESSPRIVFAVTRGALPFPSRPRSSCTTQPVLGDTGERPRDFYQRSNLLAHTKIQTTISDTDPTLPKHL